MGFADHNQVEGGNYPPNVAIKVRFSFDDSRVSDLLAKAGSFDDLQKCAKEELGGHAVRSDESDPDDLAHIRVNFLAPYNSMSDDERAAGLTAMALQHWLSDRGIQNARLRETHVDTDYGPDPDYVYTQVFNATEMAQRVMTDTAVLEKIDPADFSLPDEF